MHRRNVKLSYFAVLTALGIALHIFEASIPLPAVVPGAKLGLSNIVTLIALVLISPAAAAGVSGLRSVLGTILAGNVSALPYSFAGAAAAWAVMSVCHRFFYGRLSLAGISILGAAAHSSAQILVASLILKNSAVMTYLPILMFLSALTGLFTGISANLALPALRKKGPPPLSRRG